MHALVKQRIDELHELTELVRQAGRATCLILLWLRRGQPSRPPDPKAAGKQLCTWLLSSAVAVHHARDLVESIGDLLGGADAGDRRFSLSGFGGATCHGAVLGFADGVAWEIVHLVATEEQLSTGDFTLSLVHV